MPSNYRTFLMLLIAGGSLACLGISYSQQSGVIMAGGLAALLCLTALAAPLLRRESAAKPTSLCAFPPENSPPKNAKRMDPSRPNREGTNEGSLVDQMLAQGRYALLLRPQIAENLTPAQLRATHEALDAAMAVVPEGAVIMRSCRHEEVEKEDRQKVEKKVQVDGYYLDRFPVTNREYQKFVDADGYEQLQLWDEEIWPAMLQFTDRTGQAGPRLWENGRYPAGKEDHPVVGVSWFEAAAYARWTGKRLASDPEWVKAAVWPVTSSEGARLMQRRFPWGESMERSLANLWGSGPGNTVPVTEYPEGASVGGIRQLVGNVWEWTNTNFGAWEPSTARLETEVSLKSLRGGAFDTYFEAQAQCQFQSGDNPLTRKHNIGFRCAVGFREIAERREEALERGGDDEIHEPGFNEDAQESEINEEVLS